MRISRAGAAAAMRGSGAPLKSGQALEEPPSGRTQIPQYKTEWYMAFARWDVSNDFPFNREEISERGRNCRIDAATRPVSMVGCLGQLGIWQVEGILLQTPATANHSAEYIIEASSINNLKVAPVTPRVSFPKSYINPAWGITTAPGKSLAWGRTPGGQWWIALTGSSNNNNQNTVVTEVWRPGQAAWTSLPTFTLNSPANGSSSPVALIYRGRNGHAWLVSDCFGTNRAQTIVYRLVGTTWKQIHAFPIAQNPHSFGGPQPWLTAYVPGQAEQLLVLPEGPGNGVFLSTTGSILKTVPTPNALTVTSTLSVSPSGIIYFRNMGSKLWQWQGNQAKSLVPSGSTLSNGFTWRGFWHNNPVVSIFNSNGGDSAYMYQNRKWIPAPFIVRKGHNFANTVNHVDYVARWKGSTLWTVGGGQNSNGIYVRQIAPNS